MALAEDVLLVENAPTPLAALSPEGCVALANRSLRELLGYQEDLAGRPVDGTSLDARITTVVVRDGGRVARYLLCLIHSA